MGDDLLCIRRSIKLTSIKLAKIESKKFIARQGRSQASGPSAYDQIVLF